MCYIFAIELVLRRPVESAYYSILKSFAQLEEAPGVPGLDLPGLDIVSVAKGFGLRSVQANTAEEIRDQFNSPLRPRVRR